MPTGVYVRTEKTRKKMSEAHKGKHLSEECKRKISEANKGRHFSEEHKRKISEVQKGRHHSEEVKRKISEALKGRVPWNKEKHLSEETRKKMSEARKGHKVPEETRKKISEANKGHPVSDKTREKLRQATAKYLEEHNIIPNVGKHEKEILDELERELHYKILRQYKVGKYHLDGYIPELRLAIEVDEKRHRWSKWQVRDKEREEYIKKKLECVFWRIKDY